ncbi:MAG: zinc-ribbon domain-containing protein [Clostridia bacterium]|nr:zinc-ribbon domain-containing protein [Clostridia bacterium]
MKYCSKCGKEMMDEAVICPNCGCAADNRFDLNQKQDERDEISVGLCILSALIPLFGIIYWPVKHKATPKKASACGIAAIVSWVVWFVIYFVTFLAYW